MRTPRRERVLGLAEIADLLGARPATVWQWHLRGQLPAPDMTVSRRPAWYASTLRGWRRPADRGRDGGAE